VPSEGRLETSGKSGKTFYFAKRGKSYNWFQARENGKESNYD